MTKNKDPLDEIFVDKHKKKKKEKELQFLIIAFSIVLIALAFASFYLVDSYYRDIHNVDLVFNAVNSGMNLFKTKDYYAINKTITLENLYLSSMKDLWSYPLIFFQITVVGIFAILGLINCINGLKKIKRRLKDGGNPKD